MAKRGAVKEVQMEETSNQDPVCFIMSVGFRKKENGLRQS